MTGIERIGRPITTSIASRRPGASGFSVPLQSANAGATTAATEASAPTLATMLSLQELGGETVQDREAAAAGTGYSGRARRSAAPHSLGGERRNDLATTGRSSRIRSTGH